MRTKFPRPRTLSDAISRDRFYEGLNSGLERKITLVCAPAGYGKTTLIAEWLESSDRLITWFSLDEHDNELRAFVYAFATSLQTVLPDACQNTANLLKARQLPPLDQLAVLLINDLADLPEDVILVVDDYHLIHTSEIHNLFTLLIEHLPPPLHLVLATRFDPPLSLSRWRAKGYLHELRSVDLRFTPVEIEALLTRVLDQEAAHEIADALEEVTEGWIALLRLITLSLNRVADRKAFIERLRKSPEKYLNDYLIEEVLNQQTPAVQALLMRVSMLEQFCIDLCVAIMGNEITREQVQATLDWLEHSNTFLVSLDELQGWYRFHHLFRMLLRQRMLEHITTDELAALHHLASVWYGEQGLIEEALKHALEAGDGSFAARLVEAQFLPAREQERWMHMERWLHMLPEEQIQSSPILLCARVWIMQTRGQHADLPHLLTATEQLLTTSDEDNRQIRLLHAMIEIAWSNCYYRTGQSQLSLQSARSALAWLPPGEQHVEIHALMYLALSSQLTGQEDVALIELDNGLKKHSTNLMSTAHLLMGRALVYLAAGKLHHVEQTARHLLQIAREGDLSLSQNYAHWLLGVVHYERNLLDEAVYHFSVVITNRHFVNFWAVQDAMCGLILAYHAQGLGKKAQEAAHTLLNWVQAQHNMDELKTTYALCAQLALLQDEVEEAAQWLELGGEQHSPGPMRFLADPSITRVWLLLAQGDEESIAHEQALLDDLLLKALSIHNTRKIIQVLLVQVWAYDLQGRLAEALDVLERALALGRPGGFIRVFADLLPLATVRQKLRKRRKAHHVLDNKFDAYLKSILAAMIPLTASPASKGDLMRQEGLDPLTERELHILRLLNKNQTNKEIARELVVTTGTVKVHTKNIYRKLSVNNRQAAVTLSKALGLLDID